MKIRGNTVGTPINPKKVLVRSENLTEEEKAIARANIGAVNVSEDGSSILLGERGKRIVICAENPTTNESGYITAGKVGFYARDDDQPVILSNVADGAKDSDVATVGQLKKMFNYIISILNSPDVAPDIALAIADDSGAILTEADGTILLNL